MHVHDFNDAVDVRDAALQNGHAALGPRLSRLDVASCPCNAKVVRLAGRRLTATQRARLETFALQRRAT